jgi:signal transduction histidine kinase
VKASHHNYGGTVDMRDLAGRLIDGQGHLRPDTDPGRIAQEALSNAVKHSSATAITITLRPMGDTLELRVDDNGRGFSSKAHGKVSGMGQRTMRYRARALGAYLEIEPGPEGGTSVCCHLRVRARREH